MCLCVCLLVCLHAVFFDVGDVFLIPLVWGGGENMFFLWGVFIIPRFGLTKSFSLGFFSQKIGVSLSQNWNTKKIYKVNLS